MYRAGDTCAPALRRSPAVAAPQEARAATAAHCAGRHAERQQADEHHVPWRPRVTRRDAATCFGAQPAGERLPVPAVVVHTTSSV